MIHRERLEKLCQRQVSVLKKHVKHRQRLIYVVSLLVVIVLLIFPAFFHHRKADNTNKITSLEKVDYHSALEFNMEKLQGFQETRMPVTKLPFPKVNIRHHTKPPSKIVQLRQHAPTRMYIDSEQNAYLTINKPSSTFLGKSSYANFGNQSTHTPIVTANRLAHPNFTIPQGEFIHAILETAIDSDLPGMIRAIIARPVYSYRADHLLIPEGSRLIGQYASQTFQGINRVMVIWQRILLPNGISIQIDSAGSDALGASGLLADSMNTHFLQRFGEAGLLSLMGAVASNVGVHATDADNASQQYRTAVAQAFQSSASHSLQHAMAIKPTLKIYQGSKVIVFVARDLDFYAVMRGHPDE